MIPEYISPPIDRVIQIALLALIASFLIAKRVRVSLSPSSLFVLLAAAVTATGISLLYSYKFRGGDYFWLRRGYPHYFWGAGDVTGYPDMTVSNALQGMDWGPAGIYLLGNIFFYASLFLCAYVIFFAIRNRIRTV
jgi:hypothetical protein